MHELGITRNIVGIVEAAAAGRRVLRVRLEIGRLTAVMPGAVRFCFDVCAEGTALDGAVLEIDEIEGRGCCRRCGQELAMPDLVSQCACGSRELRCIAGEELNVKEMEVA